LKPLNYYEQIVRMNGKADKFDLRLRMVRHALAYGVKPTASVFSTTPKTVRKWLGRYHQERLAGLNELPRTPLTCPHKTSPITERKVVQLRKRYPFMGAKRLKREHNLPCSHEAIRRILNDNGSEFIGCFRPDRTRDGFERIVEGFGAKHKRIPVRAWSYNSDVETVHRTIEDEFYDIENFESIKDFHQRVASYQANYNLV